MIVEFPPLASADPESGLLAIGGDLEVGSLLLAYRNGIFPWPMDNGQLLWFAPPMRAILPFDEFHIPRRLQRHLKKANFTFRVNKNFPEVIRACAELRNRKDDGTWIIPEMIEAYIAFHQAGYAHSFETYNQDGQLVGGLYGVRIGNFFAGESMYYRESHASKFALIKTVNYMRREGLSWIDIQMLTPLLSSFGGREIPRHQFMEMLARANN